MLSQELEQQHNGRHIVLVSHGDTLSILQATFYGTPLTQHRRYGLGTAELKLLNGLNSTEQQQHEGRPVATAAVAIAAAASK